MKPTILLLLAALLALAPAVWSQWPTSPYRDLQISNPEGPWGGKMCTDGAGGALFLLSWTTATYEYTYYLQHVDSLGYKLLGEWGTPILSILNSYGIGGDQDFISDGQGGAFFTLRYQSGDISLCAYRVDGSGNMLWGQNGVLICDIYSVGQLDYLRLIPDGTGGVVAVWAIVPYFPSGLYAFWAQRVTSEGQTLWAENGVPLCDPENSNGVFRIAPDGTGGAIIFYELGDTPAEAQLNAQRINGAGQVCWPWNGVHILPPPQFATYFYDAVADDHGGAWFAFARYSGGYQGWLQHVDSTGRMHWPQGYRINPAGSSLYPMRLCEDGGGGIYIGMYMSSPVIGSFMNRMDYGGSLLWGENGIQPVPHSLNSLISKMFLNEAGGVLCLIEVGSASSGMRLSSQRISGQGQILWTARGLPISLSNICTGVLPPARNQWVSDGSGGAIACWMTYRFSFPIEIDYAKHINANGHLGP